MLLIFYFCLFAINNLIDFDEVKQAIAASIPECQTETPDTDTRRYICKLKSKLMFVEHQLLTEKARHEQQIESLQIENARVLLKGSKARLLTFRNAVSAYNQQLKDWSAKGYTTHNPRSQIEVPDE